MCQSKQSAPKQSAHPKKNKDWLASLLDKKNEAKDDEDEAVLYEEEEGEA